MPSRERVAELLPILQAYAEGKTIEWKANGEERWKECPITSRDGLSFLDGYFYRVKPEPVKHEVWLNTYFDKQSGAFRCSHLSPYPDETAARTGAGKAYDSLIYLGPIRLEYMEEAE